MQLYTIIPENFYTFGNHSAPPRAIYQKRSGQISPRKARQINNKKLSEAELATQREGASRIIRIVSDVCKAPVNKMLSRSEEHRLVRARWLAMYIIRKRHGMSFPKIGGIFGRDHSTVVYAVRKAEECLEEAYYQILYDDIIDRINYAEKQKVEGREWQKQIAC